jgi:hypothetical protein
MPLPYLLEEHISKDIQFFESRCYRRKIGID